MTEEESAVQFGTTRIAYRVRRSSRRRTVAVAVDPRIGVLVTAPAGVPLSRLDTLVRRKARWITTRLRRLNGVGAALPPREFVSGESYLYLGRHYRLKVIAAAKPGAARLVGGWLHVPVTKDVTGTARAAAVRRGLEAWYRRHAARRLPERVAHWAPRVGVAVPAVAFRVQRRRWASCDRHGTLRFNWQIIQAPMALIDYVVVHELVHLRHKDHSKAFWGLLGRALPDYERRRERLQRLGTKMVW